MLYFGTTCLFVFLCLDLSTTLAVVLPYRDLKQYSVSGVISFPFADINETFDAWYDLSQYASRIDYYSVSFDFPNSVKHFNDDLTSLYFSLMAKTFLKS